MAVDASDDEARESSDRWAVALAKLYLVDELFLVTPGGGSSEHPKRLRKRLVADVVIGGMICQLHNHDRVRALGAHLEPPV